MSYVEWLRVRNCLRVVAIALGVVVLIGLVLRILFAHELGANDAFINQAMMDPGTTVTHSNLADGTPRTVIDDPREHTHITIDGALGSVSRTITISEPDKGNEDGPGRMHIGSVDVRSSVDTAGMRTTTINTNGAAPLWWYVAFGSFFAIIVATCLAGPFARENDGHGEIAMTRPQERYLLAIRTIGVDLAGIALALGMAVVALMLIHVLYEPPHFTLDSSTLPVTAIALSVSFAWYAIVTAATASMKRGYGVIIGFAWPVAILVWVFGAIVPWDNSILGTAMRTAFTPLSYLDPLRYLEIHMTLDQHTGALNIDPGVTTNILIEAILFIVYSALAVFQWQKVEA